MWSFILVIHFILCALLILVILLQSGKGSDIGAAFGGSSQTVFGPVGGASFLSKLTTGVAISFVITCLLLAYHSSQRREGSVVKNGQKVEEKAPESSQPAAGGMEKPETKPQQGGESKAVPPKTGSGEKGK
jgi:preprotein translocase subunit SecG